MGSPGAYLKIGDFLDREAGHVVSLVLIAFGGTGCVQ
jgi:hypothetical protein